VAGIAVFNQVFGTRTPFREKATRRTPRGPGMAYTVIMKELERLRKGPLRPVSCRDGLSSYM
jgi:hypothetical protein